MFNYHFDVLLGPNAVEGATIDTENITHLLAEPITFTTTAQGGFATCSLTLACDHVMAATLVGGRIGRKSLRTYEVSPDAV